MRLTCGKVCLRRVRRRPQPGGVHPARGRDRSPSRSPTRTSRDLVRPAASRRNANKSPKAHVRSTSASSPRSAAAATNADSCQDSSGPGSNSVAAVAHELRPFAHGALSDGELGDPRQLVDQLCQGTDGSDPRRVHTVQRQHPADGGEPSSDIAMPSRRRSNPAPMVF